MYQTNPTACESTCVTTGKTLAAWLLSSICAIFSSAASSSGAQLPETQIPQTQIPQTQIPQSQIPQTQIPQPVTAREHQSNIGNTVWEGEWQAENTLFSLRVVPQGNRFSIEPVSSLGLEWTSSGGTINGNNGTIYVEYQGVSAQVLVQLISDSSAIVRSMSCQPDYHVVCTLVRNQQALFVKVQGPASYRED